MIHIMSRHRVADYDTWKKSFDGFVDTRKSVGEKSYRILRPQGDPKNVYVLFEWDTSENAQAFMKSPALKQRMQEAGVVEAPEIIFMDLADQGTL